MSNMRDQIAVTENRRLQQLENQEISVLRELRVTTGVARKFLLRELAHVRRSYDRPPVYKLRN